MSSYQRDGHSKNLFGGVYEKNFDILKPTETPTQNKFAHLKHLDSDSQDRRSSYDENSPRRTPAHKHVDLFQLGREPLTVAAINQKFHSFESQPPSSPSLNKANLLFFGKNNSKDQQVQKDQPIWFNNPKRRNVPSQVIKRDDNKDEEEEEEEEIDPNSSRFLLNNNKLLTNRSNFNMVSFGTRKTSSLQDSNSHISGLQDELPPLKTLNDLDSSEPTFNKTLSFDSTISSKDNRPRPISSSSSSSSKFSFQPPKQSQQDSEFQKEQQYNSTNKYTQLPSNNNESSILVFGYPESIVNQVIKHFAKFGDILEDFEIIRKDPLILSSQSKKNQHPIFTGIGWVRLTYENKASSIRAIQENGESLYGCLIGCVKFSKKNLENLQNGNLNLSNDEGNDEYLDFVNHFKNNKIVLKKDDKIFIKTGNNGEKNLNEKYLKSNMSWFGFMGNLLFGWDNI